MKTIFKIKAISINPFKCHVNELFKFRVEIEYHFQMKTPTRPILAGLLLASCGPTTADRASPSSSKLLTPSEKLQTTEALPMDVTASGAALPVGVTSFGAATLGGDIYVIGGYTGKPHAYSKAGQRGALLKRDASSGVWSKVGAISPAQSMTLLAHEGRLIRIGGMEARNAEGDDADLHSLDTVEAFDPISRTWASLPSLPTARSSHDAVIIEGKLYVAGGWRLHGRELGEWQPDLVVLDLDAPAEGWKSIDAPFERRALAAATLDGKLLVIGGIGSNRNISSRVDVFDPKTGAWSRGPDYPSMAFGVSAVAAGASVVGSGADGKVFLLGTPDGEWVEVSSLAYARFFHRMIAEGENVTVLGGIRGMASGHRVRPLETFNAARLGQPTILSFEFDSPIETKNRQGITVLGDEVYLFGGNKSLGQHDFGPEFFSDQAAAMNLVTLQWRQIASYPHQRQTMSSFAAPWGQIISVGGFGHDGTGSARTQPEIFSYHPKKDEWRQIGTLEGRGRTQFGLAATDDKLWLFGGLDYDPTRAKADHFRHETSILEAKLRPSDLAFSASGAELDEPRRAFAGAALGDRFYVIGGMKEGFQLVESCKAFEFSTQTWHTVACPSEPRLSGQLVSLGDRLFLAAGSSKRDEAEGLVPNRKLEAYDPSTDSWTTVVEELEMEPKHLRMFAYGSRLLLLSAHNDDSAIRIALVDPGLATKEPHNAK